ncbi:flagellar P-ring protein FlgI [Syntrophotalea carbinolica DSM 2380]|uniref:Flagellar P-ring protein n=1 Tax=Syntrophotalea carbinolica (strain DSM 2380 / NBRC 103641 / GraBd1) TaxID=338963 RepID=FLGI_SYNC1|nr:flagellar basal body P-ring protein FlgI [Syntrophotalea carbinolica]Q3A5F5.1 RecName: Full=Flagellar P-ring protein; AltName: Full=Basal body P-ring protein; Flags: Precursor [Syntrophotalea carbinolica DSM 2380]ABA88402.1 flagellar P-ring protein FlgI [Syntrophotalea carbinolica DSM 2380]
MLRPIITLLCLTLMLCTAAGPAGATRIKDIARLQGVRSNQLVGYGLVVGLNGSGDSDSTAFTVRSLVNMMERLGVTVDVNDVKVDNVAAVIVTAELPAFSKTGSTIDVLVSSIGDADSLVGGSLLMTPLKGADGKIYAVAQGPLAVGALAFGGKAATVQKNHPTVGRIPGGALVEREVPFRLTPGAELHYQLTNPDFTTVTRMAQAINKHFQKTLARAEDSGSLKITIPEDQQNEPIHFIADLESLNIRPDSMARIVVNEKTGTIVMGEDVRIATVAVSHGNLNLIISENDQVSQPLPFSEGETVVVPDTSMEVSEDNGNLVVMEMGVSIGDVARALNAIGATPRDLIAIFQAIKAAGALHAELVVL